MTLDVFLVIMAATFAIMTHVEYCRWRQAEQLDVIGTELGELIDALYGKEK